MSRVLHEETGTSYNLFPFVDGIGYWNEDMPPFSNDLHALSPPQYGYTSTELEQDFNYTSDLNELLDFYRRLERNC